MKIKKSLPCLSRETSLTRHSSRTLFKNNYEKQNKAIEKYLHEVQQGLVYLFHRADLVVQQNQVHLDNQSLQVPLYVQ